MLAIVVCLGFLSVTGCEQLSELMGGKASHSAAPAAPAASANQAAMPATPPAIAVPPTEVVATVNGVVISKADVASRLAELKRLVAASGQTWKPLTPEQLDAVLTELVNGELMSQDAVARGLDRSVDTQRRWALMRRMFFTQEWLQWNQDRLTVSDANITDYYEQNKAAFREPERRKLRRLTVASEEPAKQALARLLSEGVEFASLAQQISSDASAPQGGAMTAWVMRANDAKLLFASPQDEQAAGVATLDPALEAAAFAIDQVNGLSNYVKGADNQYHIFQLVERQAERQRPLEELRDGIRNFLLTQRLQESIEGLKQHAKIERFPERLSSVQP